MKKKSAALWIGVLFLLGTSSFAQAGPRYHGSHHGYTTTVVESYDDCPEDHYRASRHHYNHHYRDHHRSHWKRHHSNYGHGHGQHHHGASHVYVEKHIYTHESPRVVYQQPQPVYYPPQNQYRSNNYNGDIVGDTLIGGALGAAAGAAIGAVTGNPAAGAQIGAVVGGFGGISRGVLGRGLIW